MPYQNLSDREQTAARLISQGYTTKEIAKHFGVTMGTAKYIIDKIKRELECNKNTQIAYIVTLNQKQGK